ASDLEAKVLFMDPNPHFCGPKPCFSLPEAQNVNFWLPMHHFRGEQDVATISNGTGWDYPEILGIGHSSPKLPGIVPADCREEQYPCTRLYSVHKPCKQCLNEICFYSLRRVYVINKEICVRTVCAHEELLRADLCRDKFSKCGVMATSGLCQTLGASCARSCGGC
uniref:Microfibril associated protein 2 n=1 Tax=Malurus cyaneus samueli TaxID=2593467 RepID=A0A8C5THJ9_9PASS